MLGDSNFEFPSSSIFLFLKISGRIPLILGNAHISLRIKGVFPLISLKSPDIDFVGVVKRKFSAYFSSISPPHVQ